MLRDRRRSERRAVSGVVQVQPATGGSARECRLTDISDGGVRLYVEGAELVEEFILFLPFGENRRRRCRVVWRLGHEVGAEFADRIQPTMAQRSTFGLANAAR